MVPTPALPVTPPSSTTNGSHEPYWIQLTGWLSVCLSLCSSAHLPLSPYSLVLWMRYERTTQKCRQVQYWMRYRDFWSHLMQRTRPPSIDDWPMMTSGYSEHSGLCLIRSQARDEMRGWSRQLIRSRWTAWKLRSIRWMDGAGNQIRVFDGPSLAIHFTVHFNGCGWWLVG